MRAFVIAMENEAAEVRPFLRDDDRLYVAGVGKVNAAAAAQKASAATVFFMFDPFRVVFSRVSRKLHRKL